MNDHEFDGFSIYFAEDEKGDFLAHFVEMPNVSAFGAIPEKALSELKAAWEGLKESYQKHGEEIPIALSQKEYSGGFNIRIDKRVHRDLAVEAVRSGITLNELVAQKWGVSFKLCK